MASTLLFVDDELAFEQAIKQRFRKEIKSGEYDLIFAHSGEEALKTIELDENHQIDLLKVNENVYFKLITDLQDLKISGLKLGYDTKLGVLSASLTWPTKRHVMDDFVRNAHFGFSIKKLNEEQT